MFNVLVLGLVSFLTDVSSEMIYPLLPLYLTRLGAGPAIIGLIEGMAESIASLLKVFSGYFSDRLRRRKALAILGYASSTVGKFLLYLSTSWLWVLGGRLVDRFGKGVRTAPRDALIADSIDESRRGRAYGLHRALDTAGAVVGVFLAYLFLTARRGDYTTVFFYSLIPAALGVGLLSLAKERRDKIPERKEGLSLSWRALPARLKAFLVVIFLFTLGCSSDQFLLLRAKYAGFSDTTVLLLYLVYNLVYALSSYPAGRLSDRIGRKALLVAGYAFYGLVYLGFALFSQPIQLWALFAIYGFYIASTHGVEKAFIADIAPEELRATLMGLHATIVGIGLLPASSLAGLLWRVFGAPAPFLLGSGLGFLAALGLWLVI